MRFAAFLLLALAAMPALPQSVASRMCRQADGSLRWQDGSAPCPTLSAPGGGGGFNPYAAMAPALGAMSFQLGGAIVKSLMGGGSDPSNAAAQQAAQRQREADQAALAQASAQEEARREAAKNRLLAMMMLPGGGGPAGFQGVSDAERPQFNFDENAFQPLITTLPPGSASVQLTQAVYYSEQAAQAKSEEDAAALADAAFSGALGLPTEVPVPSSTRAIKLPDSEAPRVQSVREAYRGAVEKSSEAYADVVQARQRAQAAQLALDQARSELNAAREAFMQGKKARRKAEQTLVVHKLAQAKQAEQEHEEAQQRVGAAQAHLDQAAAANAQAAQAVFDLLEFVRGLARHPNSAYQRGVIEGSACMTANAADYCAAHPEENFCADKYMTGYRVGERGMEAKLRAAYDVGRATRASGGSSFAGFNHPNAVGPCRVKWLESFNNGFFNAPFTLVGK
jgi:hypothetical protein